VVTKIAIFFAFYYGSAVVVGIIIAVVKVTG